MINTGRQNMSTREAIDKLVSGDTAGFKAEVEAELGSRAVDRINVVRIDQAQQMFADREPLEVEDTSEDAD